MKMNRRYISGLVLAASFGVCNGLWSCAANAQGNNQQLKIYSVSREFFSEDHYSESPVAPAPPPPAPPPAPPPIVQAAPPPAPFIPPPPRPFTPGIVVPSDVTRFPTYTFNWGGAIKPTDPTRGLQHERQFPAPEDCNGDADHILVRAKDAETKYHKLNPYTVKLDEGTVLVAVKRPSKLGLVETVVGKIALYSNGDVLVETKGDLLKIMNLDALGRNCRVNLTAPHFQSWKNHIFDLKPGYELIACSRPLTRAEMRPKDGLMRKQTRLVESDHLAISQFHLETALSRFDLIANLNREASSALEKRVITDMSKMAAVLNAVEGYNGFQMERPDQRLAGKPQKVE